MTSNKLKPVESLQELRIKSAKDDAYARLLMTAAENLAWDGRGGEDGALRWLETNAMETSEEGVVDEINFCIDLI